MILPPSNLRDVPGGEGWPFWNMLCYNSWSLPFLVHTKYTAFRIIRCLINSAVYVALCFFFAIVHPFTLLPPFSEPKNSCLSSIFSLMSICWLLGQQKYVALVLVQSEDYYYDCFRAFALRYPTFLSLVSFLIMVVIVGFKYRSSFSILVFA